MISCNFLGDSPKHVFLYSCPSKVGLYQSPSGETCDRYDPERTEKDFHDSEDAVKKAPAYDSLRKPMSPHAELVSRYPEHPHLIAETIKGIHENFNAWNRALGNSGEFIEKGAVTKSAPLEITAERDRIFVDHQDAWTIVRGSDTKIGVSNSADRTVLELGGDWIEIRADGLEFTIPNAVVSFKNGAATVEGVRVYWNSCVKINGGQQKTVVVRGDSFTVESERGLDLRLKAQD